MLPLPPEEYPLLRPWFWPERPGPLVYPHVVSTRRGRCLVDRLPGPRTVLAEVGGNYGVRGDADHLRDPPEPITGFVDAPEKFWPALRRLDPHAQVWDRVIFDLPAEPAAVPASAASIRRLVDGDAAVLKGLSEDVGWIADTHGGASGLAQSKLGWGAFVGGRLAAVAVPFYLGQRYTDVGVVTEPGYRGRGLSTVCAAEVVADIRRAGQTPSWSTSPDNAASLGVARRLGFRLVREDRLYAVRTPVPAG